MDEIHLAHNMEQWRTFVNSIMDPRVPYNVGDFLNS